MGVFHDVRREDLATAVLRGGAISWVEDGGAGAITLGHTKIGEYEEGTCDAMLNDYIVHVSRSNIFMQQAFEAATAGNLQAAMDLYSKAKQEHDLAADQRGHFCLLCESHEDYEKLCGPKGPKVS